MPRAIRRSVVVAAILPLALALILLAGRYSLPEPEAGLDPQRATVEMPVRPSVESVPALADEPTDATPVPASVLAGPASTEAVAPARLVVLPPRVDSPDPAARRIVDRVQLALLGGLLGQPGIDVVAVSAAEYAAVVPASAGTLEEDRLVYRAVTSHYDGRDVVELSLASANDSLWSLRFLQAGPSGRSGQSRMIPKVGPRQPDSEPEAIGARLASSLAAPGLRVSFADAGTAGLAGVVLDTSRAEDERVGALTQLREGQFDVDTLAAAIELGRYSATPELRRRVWSALRQRTHDPALAASLSDALFVDPDASVRSEAALALGDYGADATAMSALQYALRNDASPEVRLAAQWAMLDFDAREDFRRERLLDSSLTPEQRMAPTLFDPRPLWLPLQQMLGPGGNRNREEALALAEIAAGTSDPALKAQSLSMLSMRILLSRTPVPRDNGAPRFDAEIVDVLIDSADADDTNVRRAALGVMLGMADDPKVRAVLESVRESDPALAEELGLRNVLEPQPSPLRSLP